MPDRKQRLSFYSYDSLGNPWLSGGGALRDFEILKRQTDLWEAVTVWVGSYPDFKPGLRDGVNYRSLGFGMNYLTSRLAFTVFANFRILFDRADFIGNSLSAYAPLLMGLLRPNRFFIVAHHYVGERSKEKYSLVGTLAWASEWLMLKLGRRLIVSNAKVAGRAREMNRKMQVLQSQNGFDATLLTVPATEAEPAFILFLGRFDIYMKGLDKLVSAFKGMRQIPDKPVNLVLAGAASPKALAAVESLIAEGANSAVNRAEIECIPNISEAKKRQLLSSCLFFCSPSRFEGWGIAALEANASGKPVLVTRADGFLDSIKDGYSGLMVAIDDEQELIAGLEKLTQDQTLRLELGKNARKWASQFSWSSIAEREWKWLAE